MADGARISRSIPIFNNYVGNTTAYLQEGTPTNGERLGFQPDEVIEWVGINTAWQPLYGLYTDKKNTRTPAVTAQLHNQIDHLRELDKTHHLLDRIAASPNVTIVDLETFNIKKGPLQKSSRTIPQKPIEALVVPEIHPIGGGVVSIRCGNTVNASKAKISEANCVEYRYFIGLEQPSSVNDEQMKEGLSSKASFNLNLPPEMSGQNLYIYFRWYNTKHHDLAGPWCSMERTLLL